MCQSSILNELTNNDKLVVLFSYSFHLVLVRLFIFFIMFFANSYYLLCSQQFSKISRKVSMMILQKSIKNGHNVYNICQSAISHCFKKVTTACYFFPSSIMLLLCNIKYAMHVRCPPIKLCKPLIVANAYKV